MWTRRELKENAKTAFKANYWRSVLVALIISVFLGGGASIGSTFSLHLPITSGGLTRGNTPTVNSILDAETKRMQQGQSTAAPAQSTALPAQSTAVPAADAELDGILKEYGISQEGTSTDKNAANTALLTAILAAAAGFAFIIVAAALVINILLLNPLIIGCRSFFVKNSGDPDTPIDEVKKGFTPSWKRNVGAMLQRDIFILLWSLLFIIPGIVKSYSYRMVPYILAENDEISGKEAIELSMQMMNGHKWNTFVLDLSFLGWQILSAFTLGILSVFYVAPYIHATDAELYKTLRDQ